MTTRKDDEILIQSFIRELHEKKAEGLGCTRELISYLSELERRIVYLERHLTLNEPDLTELAVKSEEPSKES